MTSSNLGLSASLISRMLLNQVNRGQFCCCQSILDMQTHTRAHTCAHMHACTKVALVVQPPVPERWTSSQPLFDLPSTLLNDYSSMGNLVVTSTTWGSNPYEFQVLSGEGNCTAWRVASPKPLTLLEPNKPEFPQHWASYVYYVSD